MLEQFSTSACGFTTDLGVGLMKAMVIYRKSSVLYIESDCQMIESSSTYEP